MDVKSAFLIGFIDEEVYIKQSPGFVDPTYPDFAFKFEKILYGLKQAPRAWYERLSYFLVENGFVKDKVDNTLFTKYVDNDILIVQTYVDDIIFRSTNENLCKDLESCMKKEFEMCMVRGPTIFLDSKSSKGVMGSSSIKPNI